MTPLSPTAAALLYAGLASLWIVVSSLLLSFSTTDAALQGRIELAKGLAFVVVTSLLFYAALHAQAKRLAIRHPDSADTSSSTRTFRALPVLALSVLTVPLLAFVVFAFNSAQQEQQTLRDLQSIATLKAGQIESWVSERVRDGAVLSSSTGFIERVRRIQKSESTRDEELVRDRLAAMIYHYQYESMTLVDAAGKTMLSVGRSHAQPDGAPALISTAFASGQAQLGELARDASSDAFLDVYAPLIADGEPVGVVILASNPERFLYPLVRTWPTASPTGEILLVRRDGDSVLYLNDLRHRSGTAFNLRQPLATANLPAAMAVRAARPGTLRGVDYRGASVLGAHLPIAGTTWHIVTKIDRVEAIAPAWYLAFWVGLVASFAYAIVAAVVLALHREQQRVHHLSLQAQSDRLLKQFYDLPFIGMAVTSPATKRWERFNERLCEILGYSRAELSQKNWAELTHPEDLDRDVAEFGRLLRGESEGYAIDKRFIRKDGAIVHTSMDVKCVRKPDGAVDYLIAMIQDITARKTAEEHLARLVRLYETLSRVNNAIVKSRNEDELFPVICRAAVESAGMAMAWIGLVDTETDTVRPVASYGTGTEYLDDIHISVNADDPHSRGPTGSAIRENQPIWCQDFRKDVRTEPWRRHGTKMGWKASAALPLTRGGVAVGAVSLYSSELNAFDAQTQSLLLEIARDTSFALDGFDHERARVQTEQETIEQLDELRRWNAATLKREERILVLKREVNELLSAAGVPPRYPSAETEDRKEHV